MQLLFVYGTLKKGKYHHARFGMDKMEDMGKESITGYTLVQPTYVPFPLCIAESGRQVTGELYLVTPKVLDLLGHVEKGSGYKRIEVTTTDNQTVFVYIEASDEKYSKLTRFEEF